MKFLLIVILVMCSMPVVAKTANEKSTQNGKVEAIKSIVSTEANINTISKKDMTPLMIATERCDIPAITALIHAGANTNYKNHSGNTAAMFAAASGCAKGIDIIMTNVATDLRIKNNKGLNAAMFAAQNCMMDTMDAIFNYGLDKSWKDVRGLTAMQIALYSGCPTLPGLATAEFDGIQMNGQALRGKAETENIKPVVQTSAKIDVTPAVDDMAKYSLDWTPIMHASFAGRLNEVVSLIASGGNVNAADDDGFTPLMLAVSGGNRYVVSALLEAGANVDAQDNEGFTALMVARQMKYKKIEQLLIRYGATH
jgi:ankyrin repeat protein